MAPPRNGSRPSAQSPRGDELPNQTWTGQSGTANGTANGTAGGGGKGVHDDESVYAPCLCTFDIDRTLTGRQGDTCGGRNEVIDGVWDPAYGGGPLTLSALGRAGVDVTFCRACYLGVISAGSAGGSGERSRIADGVLGGRAGNRWSGPSATSPLIVDCYDTDKASCALGIRRLANERAGIHISRSNVYHFDDKSRSVSSFQGSGMNAIQVSCDSRSGSVGRCGATPGEIQRKGGVHYCSH